MFWAETFLIMIRLIALMLLLPQLFQDTDVRKNINKNRSVLSWKGTKMLGSGSHEGTLPISEGYLHFKNGEITGGKFTVDMKRMRITDIPAHEVVPIRNLTAHLNEELETEKYPSADFTITHAVFTGKNQMKITGRMRIKNLSKTITILAGVQRSGKEISRLSTSFLINRFDWNIGNNRSWLEKRLVDKDIRLNIVLVME